jgi:hypothetical protein
LLRSGLKFGRRTDSFGVYVVRYVELCRVRILSSDTHGNYE